ncbi:MAG: hypothetical protein IH897_06155 [Planctomycetes bacterium]|nr:hypothetical protein [Planctomycetota bacterium]
MVALTHTHRQVPLIHFVESDDLFLHDQVDVVWFDVLNTLDYHAFQATAAHYYEQLFTFNQQQKQRRIERRENPPPPNPETQGQATQRTLLERATLDKQALALYERPQPTTPLIHIAPHEVVPGVTPPRLVGRPAKCFFAMLYGFLGTTLAGQPAEPEFVHQRLRENPAFARTCGFTIPRPGKPERQSDIPSLRKLQQFDQIMTAAGLWEELALDRVAANLREGKITVEATLVHDTTHYHAYSSMQVVELPEAAEELSAPADKATAVVKVDGKQVAVARVEVVRVPVDQIGQQTAANVQPADSPSVAATETNTTAATGKTAKTPAKTAAGKPNSKPAKNRKSGSKAPKKKRKSHPRTTKNCRCQDRPHCDHAWVNADVGAGTVVKSTGKMYWGHKASTLSFAEQEVLLDAVAMSDAASHDSQSLVPHLSRLLQRHPDLRGLVTRVLDDGAADDPQRKASIREQFGIELLAPINPRRRQPIRGELPRGIDHLTPRGVPVCKAGYPLELLGFRKDTEHFLFRAPADAAGKSVCQDCALRVGCYRGQSGGRVVTISADRLPWLDRELPQLSKRFAKAMARRTSIERLHKLMKFDFGDDRLTKRGNDTFQARLDKTLFAMHVLLSHES